MPEVKEKKDTSLSEQLRVQAEHDRNLQHYKDNPTATPEPEAPIPATELDLEDHDADPFGGNINNRRVAERVAAQKSPEFLNFAIPTHGGDPNKAREDIQKSKAINPDPVIPAGDGDEMLPVSVPTGPTPGSPAAEAANAPSAPLPPAPPDAPPMPAGMVAPSAPSAPPKAPGKGSGWKRNA